MAAPVSDAVIYQEVKEWIAQQEAFEAEHRRPAPLTNAQRKALEVLRLSSSAHSQAPSVASDINYVGMLGEYRQKHTSFEELYYVEEASGVLAGGTIGRICRVTIGETLALEGDHHIDSFPAVGYGLSVVDGKAPLFPTKKAAKHFAAKCALDWLVAHDYTPPYTAHGITVTPPKTPLVAVLKRSTQGTNNVLSPPPKRQATVHDIAGAAEDTVAGENPAATTTTTTTTTPARPATELVAALCKDLNFPAPRYSCERSTPGADTFDGFPEFDDYGDEELVSLRKGAMVDGVAGQQRTRQAVAEKLLVLLQGIQAQRDAQLKLLMDQLESDDNTASERR